MMRWTLIALLLAIGACAREPDLGTARPEEPGAAEGVDPLLIAETEIEVPVDALWINTGIRLRANQRIVIDAQTDRGNPPVGDPVPDPAAPLPLYGEDGLIGRAGEDGFPFAIPGRYEIQGSSLTDGEFLFVGRNVAPTNPFAAEATAQDALTTDAGIAELVEPDYEPRSYRVHITVRQTDAPALLTPIDGFFDSNPNPIFDWDEIDNASQYNLDISDFPDFRRVIFSVNVGTTSINTATLQVDPTNPAAPVNPNLDEGVYYWRVRAQVNDGRLLNPNLLWTERSVPFRLGVETLDDLPAPELLTPAGELSVEPGSVVPFEVLAVPDASGLRWRYRFFSAACGEVIDPTDGRAADVGSPWMVFQKTYRTNRIDQPARLYATFTSPQLGEGAWLVRIETRDGLDNNGARLGILDYELTAGCD